MAAALAGSFDLAAPRKNKRQNPAAGSDRVVIILINWTISQEFAAGVKTPPPLNPSARVQGFNKWPADPRSAEGTSCSVHGNGSFAEDESLKPIIVIIRDVLLLLYIYVYMCVCAMGILSARTATNSYFHKSVGYFLGF